MIDWSRVLELRDEVGADDFDEVVDLFLEEVGEVIARLRSGSSDQALRDDLHFLRGSALSLGFTELSALCQDGEQRAGQPGEVVDTEAVIASFDRAHQAFLAGLPMRLSA